MAKDLGAILLFHASEPVGHTYAGKQGGNIAALYRFIEKHPETKVVAAHWGGGLPLYALMPEVQTTFMTSRVHFDTAATSLLYNNGIYETVRGLTGAGSILFGSDYPLLSQKRSVRRIRELGLSDSDLDAIIGGNATRLLGIDV
jgi:predicted TIM-barrel fold metal-dependent hydrolase